MRKIAFLSVLICFLSTAQALAQYTSEDRNEQTTPAGMYIKKVNNDVSVLIPNGTQMHQTNKSTFTMESADEYAARRFANMEKNIDDLKKEEASLKDEITRINSVLNAQEKRPGKDAQKVEAE